MGQSASDSKIPARPSSSRFQNTLVQKIKDQKFIKDLSSKKVIIKQNYRERIDSKYSISSYFEKKDDLGMSNQGLRLKNGSQKSKEYIKSCQEINLSGIKQSQAQYEQQELKKTKRLDKDKEMNATNEYFQTSAKPIILFKTTLNGLENSKQRYQISHQRKKDQYVYEIVKEKQTIVKKQKIMSSQRQFSNLTLHVESKLPSSHSLNKSCIRSLTSNKNDQNSSSKANSIESQKFLKLSKRQDYMNEKRNDILIKRKKRFIEELSNSKVTETQQSLGTQNKSQFNFNKDFHNFVNKVINTKSFEEDALRSDCYERKSHKHRFRLSKCVSLGLIRSKITESENNPSTSDQKGQKRLNKVQKNLQSSENANDLKVNKLKKMRQNLIQMHQNYFTSSNDTNLTSERKLTQKQRKSKKIKKDLNLILFEETEQFVYDKKMSNQKGKSFNKLKSSGQNTLNNEYHNSLIEKIKIDNNKSQSDINKSKTNNKGSVTEQKRGVTLYKVDKSHTTEQLIKHKKALSNNKQKQENILSFKKQHDPKNQYYQTQQKKNLPKPKQSHQQLNTKYCKNCKDSKNCSTLQNKQKIKYSKQDKQMISHHKEYETNPHNKKVESFKKIQTPQKSIKQPIQNTYTQNANKLNEYDVFDKRKSQTRAQQIKSEKLLFTNRLYQSGRVLNLKPLSKAEISLQKSTNKLNLSKSLSRTTLQKLTHSRRLIAF